LFRNICNICLIALTGTVLTGALAVPVVPAAADHIADKQAQARQLQDEIEATNIELSAPAPPPTQSAVRSSR
jgi:hypothetical protein